MCKKELLIAFCLAPFVLIAQEFSGDPASMKWRQINTSNARVIFPAGLDSQASHIMNVMELLTGNTIKTIGNKQRKWNIILQNQTTISNAYVSMAPIRSELYMT